MTCNISYESSYEFISELWDDKWEFISQQYEKSNQTNQSYELKGIKVLKKIEVRIRMKWIKSQMKMRLRLRLIWEWEFKWELWDDL